MSKRFLLTLTGCLLVPFLLVGCNGGEDFSDADIGGPVIQPEPGGGGPLDPEIERITIEFVDDRVENLGYECRGDPEGGGGYIGRNFDNNPPHQDDDGNELPGVATCGVETAAVDFFIGDFEEENKRITLGTFYLPQEVQQPRYQIAPTDIVQSPARISADEDGSKQERRALFMAALLQALDTANSEEGAIEIPFAAHEAVTECCPDGSGDAVEPPPDPLWDYTDYDDFLDAWYPSNNGGWFDRVDELAADDGVGLEGFPGDADAVLGDPDTQQTGLAHSLNRLRAGTWRLVTAPFTREFVESGEGAALVPPMVLQLPVLVFPDGEVHGVGYAADVSNSNNQAQVETDTMVALGDGAQMDRELRFTGDDGMFWPLGHVLDSNSNPSVDLDLSGRMLGISLYYALDGPEVTGTDFEPDYPQDGTYTPDPATDGGRYDGSAFGTSFNQELLQGSREGIVAVNVDKDLFGTSNNLSFYELTPRKACVPEASPDSECDKADVDDIPDDELGGVNYPDRLDTDGSDDEEGAQVETEQNKPATDTDDQESFNVQIRDDGYVVTDLDGDCAPTTYDSTDGEYTDDTGTTEYRVGFVTRTHSETSPGSLNMIVHMTGPADLKDVLPHYGLRTTGRIDLDTKEFNRTGDSNFDNGIRALWLDQSGGAGYAYKLYEQEIGGEPSNSTQKQERLSRIRGALDGSVASCN